MEKEKNIMKMEKQNLKGNTKMEIDGMEQEVNIMLMEIQNLKGNILMEKDGMELQLNMILMMAKLYLVGKFLKVKK